MAQPADTTPPLLVEAMGVSEPSGERVNRVEVVESNETEGEELFTRPRPAKAPTRPTRPMRSKSIIGVFAAETTSRNTRAMRGKRDQGGRRGVVIVEGGTCERKGACTTVIMDKDDCYVDWSASRQPHFFQNIQIYYFSINLSKIRCVPSLSPQTPPDFLQLAQRTPMLPPKSCHYHSTRRVVKKKRKQHALRVAVPMDMRSLS